MSKKYHIEFVEMNHMHKISAIKKKIINQSKASLFHTYTFFHPLLCLLRINCLQHFFCF